VTAVAIANDPHRPWSVERRVGAGRLPAGEVAASQRAPVRLGGACAAASRPRARRRCTHPPRLPRPPDPAVLDRRDVVGLLPPSPATPGSGCPQLSGPLRRPTAGSLSPRPNRQRLVTHLPIPQELSRDLQLIGLAPPVHARARRSAGAARRPPSGPAPPRSGRRRPRSSDRANAAAASRRCCARGRLRDRSVTTERGQHQLHLLLGRELRVLALVAQRRAPVSLSGPSFGARRTRSPPRPSGSAPTASAPRTLSTRYQGAGHDTKQRHGRSNPAKSAVARKIFIAAWAILARGEPFKPSTAASAVAAAARAAPILPRQAPPFVYRGPQTI
jgi:hypothetical protein